MATGLIARILVSKNKCLTRVETIVKLTKKVLLSSVLAVFVVMLSACQSPQNVQQLKQENKQLQSDLSGANQQIAQLQKNEQALQSQVQELNRVMGVLGTEKSSRVQESSQLRGLVRAFVQDQIDLLKDFLVKGDLLDYIGGELVARNQSAEIGMLLVDLKNPMPREGVLTGVGAHFNSPGNFSVKVLRPIADDLVVVWESRPFQVASAGKVRVNFPVNVGVDKGDLIGYYFPQQVMAGFDTGTGNTRTVSGDLSLGKAVSSRSLDNGRDKRAYSLGVYGLLR